MLFINFFSPNFRQYRKKEDILFVRNQRQVEFHQGRTFEFDAEASFPLTEDDEITFINIVLNVSFFILFFFVFFSKKHLTNTISRVYTKMLSIHLELLSII